MPTDHTDETDSTEPDQPTRRDVLASAGTLAALPAVGRAGAATDGTDADVDDARIPAPFDAMPTIDEPTDAERAIASVNFPPEAVPDEGAIPDVHHEHHVERAITVPAWGLEAARWRLQCRLDREGEDAEGNDLPDTPADVERWRVEEALMASAQLRERFRTPDGRDAVDAVLAALEEGDHARL